MAHSRIRSTRWAREALGAIVVATMASSLISAEGAAAITSSTVSPLHTAATQTLRSAQSGQAQMKTIACPTSTRCLAIGAASSDQGVISYSADAGVTWSAVAVFDPTTILSLNSLTCPSSTECVAVGASLEHRGVAIVGHFAKAAWSWSPPITMPNESTRGNPPTVALNSVACVSVDMCVAVGSDLSNSINVTTYTTNAGRSWAPAAIAGGDGVSVGGYQSALSSVNCNSPTSCVAVGSDATGHGVVTYATFAAGVWTWSTAATQLPGDGAGGYLTSIRCYSAIACVAVGSDSAGQGIATVASFTSPTWTWSSESIVAPDASGWGMLFALSCTPLGECQAVGVDKNSQSITTRSLDGGSTWSNDVVVANDGAIGSFGNDPASVFCTSASRCITVGTDALSRAFYSSSSNAGINWSREALFNVAALPGQGPLSYTSCSGNLCVAVGSNDHNHSVVSRSTDYGRTWSAETALKSDDSGASYIQGVSCVGPTLCVVVGWDNLSRPVFSRSIDAGRTWSTERSIATDFSSVGFLNHVSCPNVHRCIAVGWDGQGQAVTTHSLDGGKTFARETTVTSDATRSGFLYSISCPRSTYCVAVGRDDQFKGVAAYSTNGGIGWSGLITLTSVTKGTGALEDVSCPSVTLCIGVGGTGTGAGASVTSRSTDGGKTWSHESTVALDTTKFGLLTSVSCPSATLCVAGGTDGFEQAVTTYTLNKGLTWSREATTMSVGHKDFLTGVSCPTTILCVGVGADTAQRGIYVPIRLATNVTFAAPGAKGHMAMQTAWSAQRLHAVSYAKKGYRFLGWSLSRAGRVAFVNRQRFNFLTNLTLYAVWAKK